MLANSWTNRELIDILDGRLMFNSSGLVYKEAIKIDSSTDGQVEISSEFIHTGGAGICFFVHDNENYMSFEINDTSSMITRTFRGKKSVMNSVNLPDGISLMRDSMYKIKVIINGYNVKTYIKNPIGEDFILLNNTDQASFRTGYIGLVGIETEFKISEDQSVVFSEYENIIIKKEGKNGWTKNFFTDGAILDYEINGDIRQGIFKFNIPIDNSAFIASETKDFSLSDNYKQNIMINEAGTYSFGVEYKGDIYVAIVGKDGNQYKELDYSDIQRREVIHYTSQGNEEIQVIIGSIKKGYSFATKPQIEKGYGTLYTPSNRSESELSMPCKKLNVDNRISNNGAISLVIQPINGNFNNDYVFYYNDSFSAIINNGEVILRYGSIELKSTMQLLKNTTYRITCAWYEDSIFLDIYDYSKGTFNTVNVKNTVGQIPSSQKILLGCNNVDQSNILIDEIEAIVNIMDINTLRGQFIYGNKVYSDYALKASFNQNTFLYNENKINIPYFDMKSPLIVEDKTNNIVYSRVAFFNYETGRYTLYNEEDFYFMESDEFKLGFDNVLKVWVYDEGGDEYQEVEFKSEVVNGEKTGNTIIYAGELTPDDQGKKITVRYLLKDSYCIAEDETSGNYLIEFSNVYGGDIVITIEEFTDVDKKQLKSIELNPFMSTNNTGFVFLEEEERPVQFLYANASPDSIVADGYDKSIITIDCLDKDSVPTNNVFLYDSEDPERITVYSKYGHGRIELYMTEEEKKWWDYLKEHGREAAERDLGELINDENRAGRYIFNYIPNPFLNEKIVEKQDYVVIVDGKTQISTEVPIRIVGGW